MDSATGGSEIEENVLDFDRNAIVEPYRFEPMRGRCQLFNEDSSSEAPSDSEDSDIPGDNLDSWCSCNNCREMPTGLENRCCHYYKQVTDVLKDEMKCITEHDGFIGNCLNPYVLEASVYEFVRKEGPLGDDEPVNELMRYLSYSRFVRWIFGKLGAKNRRTLPSCAVLKIRETFPSDFYFGFRYPIY